MKPKFSKHGKPECVHFDANKTDEGQGPHTWKQYEQLIKSSRLRQVIKETALQLCRRLFEVEAEFHDIPLQTFALA